MLWAAGQTVCIACVHSEHVEYRYGYIVFVMVQTLLSVSTGNGRPWRWQMSALVACRGSTAMLYTGSAGTVPLLPSAPSVAPLRPAPGTKGLQPHPCVPAAAAPPLPQLSTRRLAPLTRSQALPRSLQHPPWPARCCTHQHRAGEGDEPAVVRTRH